MSRTPPGIPEAARALGVEVPAEGIERLEAFEGLLLERAIPLGIVAESDGPRIRDRHVLDCLRAAALVEGSDRLGLDAGSGSGLPGLVVAIVCPRLEIRLVEPRRRRVAFLELAIEQLGLGNASVSALRIEDLGPVEADLCFARALAPLGTAWSLAAPSLRIGGRLVYFAGAGEPPEALEPPAGTASFRLVSSPVLESAGPLAIMTR
jgi:16S rRNA (guanine527-N7)-methyltransferase